MANDLLAMQMQNLAGGLEVLKSNCSMLKALNYVFDPLAGGKSSTVEVYTTSRGNVNDVVPANTPPVGDDVKTESIKVPCQYWKETNFVLTFDQLASLDVKRRMLLVEQKVQDLIQQINAHVISQSYKKLHLTVGTIGTPAFATNPDIAVDAAEKLNLQLAPQSNRCGILSTRSYANAIKLPAFQYFQNSNSDRVMREGELGRQFGADWMYDQQMAKHTAGTAAGYVLTAPVIAGQKTAPIGTGTGTFNIGDVFTVAGDTQTYAVTSSTATTLQYYPANATAWVSGAAITKLATHNVDLFLQKDCIAFVHRPMVEADELIRAAGGFVESISDIETGLSLRHQITMEHKQIRFSFEMLYGFDVLRPQFGVRIIS